MKGEVKEGEWCVGDIKLATATSSCVTLLHFVNCKCLLPKK